MIPLFTVNKSTVDASVNFTRAEDVGSTEARYVRRAKDYLIAYLSSQTGCNMGCRMCHLTATGQTDYQHVTHDGFMDQASTVLNYYREGLLNVTTRSARSVKFSFMARGEALANPTVFTHAGRLFNALAAEATKHFLVPRFSVSTIMPKMLGNHYALEEIFTSHHPDIYYSIYSTNKDFRRKWLPKALPVDAALDKLVAWQKHTNKIVKLHHAYIAGENDSLFDVNAICDAVEKRKLLVNVNIVRYNPLNPAKHGREPDVEIIERNADTYRRRLPYARVKVIERVGQDVQASCGMFIPPAPKS